VVDRAAVLVVNILAGDITAAACAADPAAALVVAVLAVERWAGPVAIWKAE